MDANKGKRECSGCMKQYTKATLDENGGFCGRCTLSKKICKCGVNCKCGSDCKCDSINSESHCGADCKCESTYSKSQCGSSCQSNPNCKCGEDCKCGDNCKC